MRSLKILSVVSMFFLLSLPLAGQDTIKKVKILPVPTIGYSPETRTYVGAVSLFTIDFYNDPETRRSNAKVELNYTWNKQFILETEWNYFFRKEKWFTSGRIHYSGYPDSYFGIGADTPENNINNFSSNRLIVEVSLLRNTGPKFFVGPNLRYLNYWNVAQTGMVNYAELIDQSTIGIGFTLVKDTRNSLLSPIKGFYFNLKTGLNHSMEYYSKTILDLRFYKSWQNKYTWANRMFSEFNLGNPPFYDLAILGGDKYVRGYNYGRFRDKNLATLQTEFRLPLIWRIGLATFGGVSNLFPDFQTLTKPKWNAGMGLRFLVDKQDRTNLRFDYAVGHDGNSGFYISFGESF